MKTFKNFSEARQNGYVVRTTIENIDYDVVTKNFDVVDGDYRMTYYQGENYKVNN